MGRARTARSLRGLEPVRQLFAGIAEDLGDEFMELAGGLCGEARICGLGERAYGSLAEHVRALSGAFVDITDLADAASAIRSQPPFDFEPGVGVGSGAREEPAQACMTDADLGGDAAQRTRPDRLPERGPQRLDRDRVGARWPMSTQRPLPHRGRRACGRTRTGPSTGGIFGMDTGDLHRTT